MTRLNYLNEYSISFRSEVSTLIDFVCLLAEKF